MSTDMLYMKWRAFFESLDKISSLPEEVMVDILHRLPIREAVKTSLLSSSWRYRWMSMPNLVFDARSLPAEAQKDSDQVKFVTNALLLHNGIISKFEVNNFLMHGCSDVDRWILVLSRENLNHLVLVFNQQNPYQVPACLFYCQTLRKLNLEGCIIKLPSQCHGFCNLTYLEIFHVTITNESLENLVLKIPLLQTLRIFFCESLTRFNLNAPNLNELWICGPFENVNFQNIPNVTSAAVCIKLPGSPNPRCRLDEVLGGLSTIQGICIFHPFLEFLKMETAPERLNFNFDHLTALELVVNFEDFKEIVAVLCLLRSSPFLKSLAVTYTVICGRQSLFLYNTQFWEALLCKQDVFHSLETVSIVGFTGGLHECGFTKFILLKAMVLKTFTIKWEKSGLLPEGKLLVVEKMMQFQRSSTKAKVIFSS